MLGVTRYTVYNSLDEINKTPRPEGCFWFKCSDTNSLNPLRLAEITGEFLSPVEVIVLGLPGLCALLKPGEDEVVNSANDLTYPFSRRLINGDLIVENLLFID